MKVVNVKVAHIRPEYKNLKEWIEENDKHVYIGREGIVFVDKVRYPKIVKKEEMNIFANPFKIKSGLGRNDVLKMYEEWLLQEEQSHIIDALLKLPEDSILGCWCKPEACHGDILKRIYKSLKGDV